MDWSSVKKTLGTLAPTIGTVLGGPLGGIAGAALSQVLGVDASDPGAVSAALAGATPDQLLALKKADQDFQVKMAQLGYDSEEKLQQLDVDDRKSARDMAMSTKTNTPAVLTYLITVGFFGLLLLMVFKAVPADSKDIINIMIGSLGTAWVSSITYWFGSTHNSMAKTQMLANSSPTTTSAH